MNGPVTPAKAGVQSESDAGLGRHDSYAYMCNPPFTERFVPVM